MAGLLGDRHHLDGREGALLLGARSLRARSALGELVGRLLRTPWLLSCSEVYRDICEVVLALRVQYAELWALIGNLQAKH